MTVRAGTLLLALLAAAPLVARQQESSPVPVPEAWDVHVLQLTTPAGSLVPVVEMVASKRIAVEPAPGEHAVHVRAGGTTFGATIRRGRDGSIRLEREIGGSRFNSAASRSLEITEPYRWGRRPRQGGNTRGAILCEPVADASKPFVALDPRAFMQHLLDVFFTEQAPKVDAGNFLRVQIRNHFQAGIPDNLENEIRNAWENWLTPKWTAARVLGSVPLRDYLEPAQIDRILSAATKLPKSIDEQEWPLLRPLVALGHRATLERLSRVPDEPDADPDRPHEEVVQTPWVPRSIEDAVMVAYATAADPDIRGLAGWVATGTRSPEVYDMLIQDVQSGRAVLPGDANRRDLMTTHLVHSRAWQSITAPLVTLLCSGAAIAAIMLLLRAIARRAI